MCIYHKYDMSYTTLSNFLLQAISPDPIMHPFLQLLPQTSLIILALSSAHSMAGLYCQTFCEVQTSQWSWNKSLRLQLPLRAIHKQMFVGIVRVILLVFQPLQQGRRLFQLLPFLSLILISCVNISHAKCVGKMVNPVSDICWKCVFPIRIMGEKVTEGKRDPKTSPKRPLCVCQKGAIPEVGIPIAFWEPARLVDVTRTPYCMVGLGGMELMKAGSRGKGTSDIDTDDMTKSGFYHAHWYVYPVLYILEALTDLVCVEQKDFDLGYLTELDPFWAGGDKSTILNPEAILFGNPIAQAACAADCISATANLPLDALFWCAGCQGSLYPFTGHVKGQYGGVQASLLIATRFMAKLHRMLLMREHAGEGALCSPYLQPMIQKSHYRLQMTYPLPKTDWCPPPGHTDITWNMGKEFPYKGEDFGYLVWRKRDCCLRARAD